MFTDLAPRGIVFANYLALNIYPRLKRSPEGLSIADKFREGGGTGVLTEIPNNVLCVLPQVIGGPKIKGGIFIGPQIKKVMEICRVIQETRQD